jgi:hypothetical protein
MSTPLDKKQSPPTAHQPLSEIAYACGFRPECIYLYLPVHRVSEPLQPALQPNGMARH